MPETRLWFESACCPTDGRRGCAARSRADASRGSSATRRRRMRMRGTRSRCRGCQRPQPRVSAGDGRLAERRSPGSDSFWTWRETMYRFVERLDPDDVEAVACQAYMRDARVRLHPRRRVPLSPSRSRRASPTRNDAEMATRIAAAAAETGIGLTLLPSFYAHGGFGGPPPAPGQRRFITDIDSLCAISSTAARGRSRRSRIANLGARATQSLRAVTPEELDRRARARGADQRMPIHMHVAEQVKEVDDCLAWSGARPVAWLLDHAPVDDRWCLIHGTHATDAELRAVARRGAAIGLCPITEGSLGDGVFGARTFLAHGGTIAHRHRLERPDRRGAGAAHDRIRRSASPIASATC